jgi:tetratricopeptide (TPR) repeat protein
VLSIEPGNTDAMLGLAAIAIERKEHAAGLALHRKLTALGGHSPEVSYNLGLLLQAAGQHSAAAECYQAAADLRPNFSEALLNLGHTLQDTGKEDDAKKAWGKALAADPALAGKYFR